MPPETFREAGIFGGLHLTDAETKIYMGLESTSASQRLQLVPCVPPGSILPFSEPLFPQLDNKGSGLDQTFVTSFENTMKAVSGLYPRLVPNPR